MNMGAAGISVAGSALAPCNRSMLKFFVVNVLKQYEHLLKFSL